jgi:hypothetical protein
MKVGDRAMRDQDESTRLDGLSELLSELMLPDDVAELRQLTELCRQSLAVRSWLFARFATESATREAFRALLSKPDELHAEARLWSPRLGKLVLEGASSKADSVGPHGGLSRDRILTLIMRHQYERLDLKTFLLVRLWSRFVSSGRTHIPVALRRATLNHWKAMVADPEGKLCRDATRAVRFFGERSQRKIGETDYGYVNSWKIHVLLYILDVPKPCYQVADLQAGLPHRYRHFDRRLIRRFCQLHGIRRDTRPGRRPGPSRRVCPR